MSPLRLAFMGTPEFAVPALEALVGAGHTIVAVYCQPPRAKGRGHKVQKSPVHRYAESIGIPVFTPISLRKPDVQKEFSDLNLDVAVVAAYGLILPKQILEAPRFGCINIHASLLPRWRGAAPIQRAILAGDTETGITIMKMDEGLDTGPILMMEKVQITSDTTASSLYGILTQCGAKLIIPALEGLTLGTLHPTPQPLEGITYADKLSREEGRLNWTEDVVSLSRRIRALNPWPGTWFESGREKIKVLEAAIASVGENPGKPGTRIGPDLTVACGRGALRLLQVQRPGRKVMDAETFLLGFQIPIDSFIETP